jgi:hypothetical protein
LPLVEKSRIEVYIPDRREAAYLTFLTKVEQEFTHAFGGCTTIRGVDGFYRERSGTTERDPINLVYCDTTLSLSEHREELADFVEKLRQGALSTLDEESVLISVIPIYHAE